MKKERTNNFSLISLINPAYVYNKVKEIRSWGELKEKINDLIVLVLKLATFRYGAGYWEKKRQEKLTNYLDEIDRIDELGVHSEIGEYYFGRKDYEKALKVYARILKLDKGNKTAYFRIGEMRYVKKEYEEAIENLKKAVEYDKNNEYACGILCKLYRQKKEYKKALELAKGDKKLESAIHLEMGEVYLKEGKYALAIEEINKALEYDKNNEYAYMELGYIYRQNKEYAKALEKYEKALELAKGDKKVESSIYNEKAHVYLRQGKYDLAVKEVNKALEYDKYGGSAVRLLGNIYRQNKEYEKALKEYKKALELANGEEKSESALYSEIAQVYLEERNYDTAMQEAMKALEYDNTNEYAYKTLGDIYFKKKQYEKALAEYKRALESAKGDKKIESAIYSEIAKVYLEERNYDLAIEEVNKALEYDKHNGYAHSILGCTYRHKRQYDAALNEFDKALKLSGGDKEYESGIYNERAQIYSKQGKCSLGMSEAAKSMELNSKNVMTHLLMSRGYKYQGKYEEALTELLKAMELTRVKGESQKNINLEIINLVEAANINKVEKAVAIAKKALESNYTDNPMVLNSLINELEIAQKATKLNSKARKLIVKVTNQCNVDCKMCFGRQTPKQEILDKIKDEVIKAFPYIEYVDWLGGEAFLYPGFEELIDEATKYPLKQGITTNALLISEATAVKLLKNNFLLTISIDGTTKEVYEEIRRGAKYEYMIEKLNMLNRVRKQVNPEYEMNLNVVVMRSNYRQIESFVEFALEHNFNTLNYMMVSENRNNENIFNFNRDGNILSYVDRALAKARARCDKYGINFNSNITKGILQSNNEMKNKIPAQRDENSLKAEGNKEKNNIEDKKVICTAPWKALLIDIQGDVIPCSIGCFCAYVVGNLNESSMEEIWNGERMVKYREGIVKGNIGEVCGVKKAYNGIPVELLK